MHITNVLCLTMLSYLMVYWVRKVILVYKSSIKISVYSYLTWNTSLFNCYSLAVRNKYPGVGISENSPDSEPTFMFILKVTSNLCQLCGLSEQSADPASASQCCKFQLSHGMREGSWLHDSLIWAKSEERVGSGLAGTNNLFAPIVSTTKACVLVLTYYTSRIPLSSCDTTSDF